jgi:hypothetical protein
VADLPAQLEADARARFVRFDAQLWRELLDGPARELAQSLQANVPEERAARLLESYLRLACEAIGHGYLFRRNVGSNFFSLAFERLIPKTLALLPAHKQGQALADCWNLGENLEKSPGPLRRLGQRLLARVGHLDHLDEGVALIADALGEPGAKLDGRPPRIEWLDLAAEDRRFLPGALHFLAPTIVCVHDRGRPETIGAWLSATPVTLGGMNCDEKPAISNDRLDLVERLQRVDGRATDALNSAANAWRAALTLETSQFLVALLPA